MVVERDPEQLLAAVADGDRAALKALYDLHGARLLAICRSVLGRHDLAEEAMQDAFVSIWRSAKSYDPSAGSPIAWIATIARRRAIDRLRASPWLQRETPDWVDHGCPPLGIEAAALKQCFDRLDEKSRCAIVGGVGAALPGRSALGGD